MSGSGAVGARFGQRMRELRLAAGLTQSQLAAALADAGGPQLDPSGIARAERGQKRIVLGEAVILARVLGSSVDALVGEAEPAPPSTAPLTAGLAELERRALHLGGVELARVERNARTLAEQAHGIRTRLLGGDQ